MVTAGGVRDKCELKHVYSDEWRTVRIVACLTGHQPYASVSVWSIITGHSSVMWPIDVEEIEAQMPADDEFDSDWLTMKWKRRNRRWNGVASAWYCVTLLTQYQQAGGREAPRASERRQRAPTIDCEQLESDSIVIKTTHRSTHRTPALLTFCLRRTAEILHHQRCYSNCDVRSVSSASAIVLLAVSSTENVRWRKTNEYAFVKTLNNITPHRPITS